jgi:prolipoprotein diacylglyceryltransferase
MGVFCFGYGVCRFLSDFLRVNDKTIAGLTGAQYLTVFMMIAGVWILTRVRTTTEPVELPDTKSHPEEHENVSVEMGEAAED